MAADPNGRKQVVLRLDKELVRRIDIMGAHWDSYRSETVDRLLRKALDEFESQKVFA